MAKKTYRKENCDLDGLFKEVETWFADQGYETQSNKNPGAWLVQARKTDTWRKALGASRAFNVLIKGQPDEFSVDIGTGEWASNLTAGGVAAILTGGVSLIGSGVATAWSKKIEADLWSYVENSVLFGDKMKSAQEGVLSEAQPAAKARPKQLEDALATGAADSEAKTQKTDAEREAKLEKLKEALNAGILNQAEFEEKKAALMTESTLSEMEKKVAKLKAALDTGILTQEEFERKKAHVEKEAGLSSKLKQLESARDAGIITMEEFEIKKASLLSGH